MPQTSRRFRTTIAVFGALVFGGVMPQMAQSQPINGLEPASEIVVTSEKEGFSVDVHAQMVSVAEVIEKIAEKTETDILILDNAEIPFVKFGKASPSDALNKIAVAAGLSVRMLGRIYVIEKQAASTKPENRTLELAFKDISIRELFSIVQTHFDLKIEVSPRVSGKLVAIRLNRETPEGVVEKIARGAKLSLSINDNGVYRVGFDDAKTPQN